MIYRSDIGTIRAQQGIIQLNNTTIGRYKLIDGLYHVEAYGKTIKTDRIGNALADIVKLGDLVEEANHA
jgi:hypothetical protein